MEIDANRSYRLVVRFPWGERREVEIDNLHREEDGTLRWTCCEPLGIEPYMDCFLAEREHWAHGWAGGCCDVTAVLSCGPGAPEP